MSRSAAFRDHLDVLGVWFPEGDGDALRGAAGAWTTTADFLEDMAAVLGQAANTIIENYRGEAADRFVELWSRWTGAPVVDPGPETPAGVAEVGGGRPPVEGGYLTATVRACRQLAATLDDFGGDVDRADETVLRLVEEALDWRQQAAQRSALDPSAGAAVDDWLRSAAGELAAGLDRQVATRTAALGELVKLPDDLAPIDPSRVDWVSPGDVADLTYLATTTVDFGAGPGTHGGGGAISPAWPSDPVGPDLSLADRGDPTTAIDPLAEFDVSAGAGVGSGGGAGGGWAGGGGGGGFDVPEFELPMYDEPEFAAPAATASLGGLGAGSALAGAAAVGAGAVVASAATGGRNSPMMPFMPMGGASAGGDDGKEPTRRRRRVVVVPPVA